MIWLYLLLLATVLFYFFVSRRTSSKSLPPGPPSLPLVGSLLSVVWADAKRPSVAFMKLGKRYGPLCSVQMGATFAVVVNGYKELMEMLNAKELQARSDENDFWMLQKADMNGTGIIFTHPEFWAKTRPFTEKTLRKYGFQGTETERIALEEMTDFCQELNKQMVNGQMTLTLTTQFNILFLNITLTLLSGKKYSIFNENTKQILEAMDFFIKSGTYGTGLATVFPKLVRQFPNASGYAEHKRICAKWRSLLNDTIEAIETEGDYLQEPTSFIEEFLLRISKTPKPKNVLDTIFTHENLMSTVQDLFLGSTDTTSRLTKFFIRYLVLIPDLQRKMQQEVEEVVGFSSPTVEQMSKLTYTKAVFYEILRHSTVADIVPRKLLTEYSFGSYVLPKGTLLLFNILALNNDTSLWENPDEFKAERFLSEQGNLINIEKLVSFGFGKRKCVGEQMAKTVMLLMMVTLIQNYSFHVHPEFRIPSNETSHGFLRDPVPFTVKGELPKA